MAGAKVYRTCGSVKLLQFGATVARYCHCTEHIVGVSDCIRALVALIRASGNGRLSHIELLFGMNIAV